MDIAKKYEDVVAERDSALAREAALRDELNCPFRIEHHSKRLIEGLKQRLTVAENLLRETSDYLDGSTRNAVWCDSILHKKMKAALKPAAEVDHGKA